MTTTAPPLAPLPLVLDIGVTGHRAGNAAYDANHAAIADMLATLLARLSAALAADGAAPAMQPRLVTNLAHGVDAMAAGLAADAGWPVMAPLPFGRALNIALNTPGLALADVPAVAAGAPPTGADAQAAWAASHALHARCRCFELAEQDAAVLAALDQALAAPDTARARQDYELLVAERSRIASAVTIEQADVLVAVWDGRSPSATGGTRDTMAKALAVEIPVVWINAEDPARLCLLLDPADLALADQCQGQRDLDQIVAVIVEGAARTRAAEAEAATVLAPALWRPRSRRRFHSYRRIETVFGGAGRRFRSLVQRYDPPIAQPQAALAALPGADHDLVERIERALMPRFALADGISTYLSDAYRGGMVASFILSAFAIVGGLAYLPLVESDHKWPFALLELVLLVMIVGITIAGTRGNWHRRWFRTRRVAEYLRSAPLMLALGAARPLGRWPRSRDAEWPERHARSVLKAPGLPAMAVTHGYLHGHLRDVILPFVLGQRDYHKAKAAKLDRVHHNLDKVSETLFLLAIASVGAYLVINLLALANAIPASVPHATSKWFTFLGVAFPTLGAALAGVRYFGDFERFAAISDVTAAKLDRLAARCELILTGGAELTLYSQVADLAHLVNDAMVEEIESWQSIFGSKRMTVPV